MTPKSFIREIAEIQQRMDSIKRKKLALQRSAGLQERAPIMPHYI